MARQLNPEKGKDKDCDENFIVYEAPYEGTDFFSCCLLVEKKKISKEALCVFLSLIEDYPLSGKSFRAKKEEESKSGGKFTWDLKEESSFYLVDLSYEIPSSFSVSDRLQEEIKGAGFLKKRLSSSYTGDEKDLHECQRILLAEQEERKKDPLFILSSYLNINFTPDLFFSHLPYGNKEKILGLKRLDINDAKNALLQADKILFYAGNMDFRLALTFKESLKPASKVFPLISQMKDIGAMRNLCQTYDGKENLLGASFRFSAIRSEQAYVSYLIFSELLKDRYEPLLYLSDLKDGAFQLGFLLDGEKEAIIGSLSELYKHMEEKDFLSTKEKTLNVQKERFISAREIGKNQIEGRLLGLNLSPEAVMKAFSTLQYLDFLNFMRSVSLIGTLKMEGERHE
jgi:hypothetical protein